MFALWHRHRNRSGNPETKPASMRERQSRNSEILNFELGKGPADPVELPSIQNWLRVVAGPRSAAWKLPCVQRELEGSDSDVVFEPRSRRIGRIINYQLSRLPMRSTLFEIFGLPIRSYGVMMVVGFVAGLWRASRVCGKRGLAPERLYDLAVIVLLSGVLGARLVYILLNPGTESFREFLAVWQGGLSFHGGVVFGLLGGYLYTRRAGLDFLKCADLIAPSAAIGYGFTRIGCFLNGCCYGAPTTLPWAVRFNEQGVLTPPSHPTQIYASLASFAIFFLLVRLEKLHRAPGFVFTSYLGLYSIYRFLIEYLRAGYSAQLWFGGLTQAQVASAAIFAVSAVVILTVYRKAAKQTDPS